MLLALLSIAAVWAISTLVILGAFAASSFDDLLDLARAAMRSAVPAAWIVPAVLLLRGPSVFEALLGLALLAYAVQLLVSARPPHKLLLKRKGGTRERFELDPFYSRTLPLIGCALLIQSGVIAATDQNAVPAGAMVACGAALVAWIARPDRSAFHTAGRTKVVATFAIAIVLTVVQFRALATPRVASPEPESRISSVPLTAPASVDPKDIRPLDGKDLVPGVVLRPKQRPPKIQPIIIRAATRRGIVNSEPAVVKFSGEYHLFPASSGSVQPDSQVLEGTPLDSAYASMSGGAIETEAVQPFEPPIDLSNCGRIELRLRNAEKSPASATLRLVTTTGTLEVGTEILGLDRNAEAVEFEVPPIPTNLIVRAIRIVFHPDPFSRSRSAKIAVNEFRLMPRVAGAE